MGGRAYDYVDTAGNRYRLGFGLRYQTLLGRGDMPSTSDRIRVIVTTDPELDDLNSMLRLVLYSNEIELAGLVYSSSKHHYAGDAERGVEPHRWPPEGARGHIDLALDAYEQVHPNLLVHDPRYPDPAHLRSLVRVGNIADVGDTRRPSPGSDLIAQVLLDDEPGAVVLQAWGGLNTIARALMTVEERHADSPQWEAIRARVTARTVLTSWGEQDDAFVSYIRPHWPAIELRQVATMVWGYAARRVTPVDAQRYFSSEWTRENVSRVGPVGAAYRVWGDGIQMAAGFDAEDYFGLRGFSNEELREQGYKVFVPVQEPGAWISEGDTSNFALHIDNGLRNWEHPENGGWGGRQVRDPQDPYRWNSVGFGGFGLSRAPTDWGDVARWVPAFQRDFAGRLQWSVSDAYSAANHHPRIEVHTGLDMTAQPGESVTIAWSVWDPDGDAVSVTFWQYREAGSCPSEVSIERSGADAATVTLSDGALAGETVHVILEATDAGEPPLTTYARIMVTVI